MADEKEELIEPQIGPIEEKLIDFAKTPVEIGYLALFVFGFLGVSAMTLVGQCGNVEDVSSRLERIGEIVPGSIVQVALQIEVENVIVQPGACAIVRDIEDDGTATIHVLAKAPPPFLTADTYEADHIFEYLSVRPIQSLFFTLSNGPIDDGIQLTSLQPIATRGFSNLARWFYLDIAFWVIMVVIVLTFIAHRLGVRRRLARQDWYRIHLRRMDYRVLLAKNRTERDRLFAVWTTMKQSTEEVEKLLQSESVEQVALAQKGKSFIEFIKRKIQEIQTVDEITESPSGGQKNVTTKETIAPVGEDIAYQEQIAIWRKAILDTDDILAGTMQLIGEFEGTTVTEMLQNTTTDDVPTLLEVWDAHKIARATRTQESAYTPMQYKAAINAYEDTLINFGLLPYKPQP